MKTGVTVSTENECRQHVQAVQLIELSSTSSRNCANNLDTFTSPQESLSLFQEENLLCI
jgi:hypothetical protein